MRRLRSEEGGFAMIVAIVVLSLAIMLGSVAALDAVGSSDTTNRDKAVKRALQAADAGVAAAIYRMNRLDVSRASEPCVTVDATGELGLTAYDSDGWCPAVTGDLGDGSGYSYRVAQQATDTGAQTTIDTTVVSSGTVAGGPGGAVTRRVAVKASALTGAPLFGDNGVISLDSLDLPNSVYVRANSRSNGDITLENSSTIEGNATPGPGHTVTPSNNSTVTGASQPAPDSLVLAPVDLGDAATNNNDSRLANCNQPDQDVCSGAWSYDTSDPSALSPRLSISNSGSVTLGGNIYVFCSLSLSNHAQLVIAPKDPGTAVRIYIRAPTDCGGTGGVSMSNNPTIVNTTGDPSAFQLYVLGTSTVTLANNITTDDAQAGLQGVPMTVYAPDSEIDVANHVRIQGALAAKKVTFANNSAVYYDSRAGQIQTQSVTPVFRRQQYRECSSVPPAGATTPDAGC